MNTQDLVLELADLLERLTRDGYSQHVVTATRKAISRFHRHCIAEKITEISKEVIRSYLVEKYGIGLYDTDLTTRQYMERRPLPVTIKVC